MGGRIVAHGGGEPLPPLTTERLLSHWEFEPVVLAVLAAAVLLYGWGVALLSRNGVSWSPWRSVLWLTGLVITFVVTSSGLAAYDTTLFSVHAVQHMLLQMLAPVPLALAAPITLDLRKPPTARTANRARRAAQPVRAGSHPPVGRVHAVYGHAIPALLHEPV